MRKLLCLVLLAGCELQPAPPKQAPAPAPLAPPQAARADAGVVAVADAKAAIEVTPACMQIGVHVAGVLIAEAPPAQQMSFEKDRERIVRATAEVCTTQQWSDAATRCYLAATTGAQLKDCETKFRPTPPPPQPAPPPPPEDGTNRRMEPGAATEAGSRQPKAGAGSAATPRPATGTGTGSAGSVKAPRAATPGTGSAAKR